MNMRTPLATIRGLGSTKQGLHHWWIQRLTSIALVPLTIWFVVSIMSMTNADYVTVVNWIRSPLGGALLLATIGVSFYHAALGLQVIAEDYVQIVGWRLLMQIGFRLGFFILGLVASVAVLKILLGAG